MTQVVIHTSRMPRLTNHQHECSRSAEGKEVEQGAVETEALVVGVAAPGQVESESSPVTWAAGGAARREATAWTASCSAC